MQLIAQSRIGQRSPSPSDKRSPAPTAPLGFIGREADPLQPFEAIATHDHGPVRQNSRNEGFPTGNSSTQARLTQLAETVNRCSRVQSLAKLQGAFDQSARVVTQAKLVASLHHEGLEKRKSLGRFAVGPAGFAQPEAGTLQLRRGFLDPDGIPPRGVIALDHADFGGLVAPYRGLHITLLPDRPGGNTVHVTAYETPNPGAEGPRTFKWYNPATGVWSGWTSDNPLLVPGNEADLLRRVEGIVDHYLLPEPQAQPSLTTPEAFPTLGGLRPDELARKQQAAEREFKLQAEKAKKTAEKEEAFRLRVEAQRVAKERRVAEARAAEEKAAAEAEAKAAKAEEQRLKEFREQQRAQFAEDISLGMEFADMYGWSEVTVIEMAIAGAFRDQVQARKRSGEPPSYIA